MKLLLIKTEGMAPLALREEHIKKIQAVDTSIEIVAVGASSQNEIERQLVDAEIIAGSPRVLPSSFKNARELKWIHSFSAGMERVLTPEVVSSQILVSNSSGIHAIPIAEHVLGFMLIFTRKFYDTFCKQQQKIWEKNQDITELRDKVVLIVGLGRIGLQAAKLVSCVGAKVIAVDQADKEKPKFVAELYSADQFGEALPKADFVVLCLPYTQETHHFFGMEKFRMMKNTAVLINIGRGGVVHEKELIEALQNKIIGGAALDVTEEEPLPPESPLWEMENVVITPHHSGWSEKYMDRAIDLFCIHLKAYLTGQPLPNLVDKEKGY